MLITGSNGTCASCYNQKDFKSVVGTWLNRCQNCTNCGGIDQDGTAYSTIPCNTTHDAVCQSCLPCPPNANGFLQVRVGCCGTYSGQCAMIDQQVGSILSTAAEQPNISSIDSTTYVLTQTFQIFLVGQYSSTSLSIPKGTELTLSTQPVQNAGVLGVALQQLLQWFTVNVIVPDEDMISTGSSDGTSLGLYSNMLYVSPEGITLSNPANLTFLLFPNASISHSRRAGNIHIPFFLYSWDKNARTWVKVGNAESAGGTTASANINTFGTYVIASSSPVQWPWWWWLILLFLLLALVCLCCLCICIVLYCKRQKSKPAPQLVDPAYSQRKMEPDLPPPLSPTPPDVTAKESLFQLDDSYLANPSPPQTLSSVLHSEKLEVKNDAYAKENFLSFQDPRSAHFVVPNASIPVASRYFDVAQPSPVFLQPVISSLPRSPLPTQAVNQVESAIVTEHLQGQTRSLNPRPPIPNHALQNVDDAQGNVYVSGGIPGKFARDIDSVIPTSWSVPTDSTPSRVIFRSQAASYSPRVLPFTYTTSNENYSETEAGKNDHISELPAPQTDWC